ENKVDETTTLLQAGSAHLEVAYPDESLHTAAEKMLRRNVGRLPVVDAKNPDKLVGYLGRTPILNARQRRLTEESEIEDGWLDRTLRKQQKPQSER
ncbi:MAG: CBS domain-containing protein, partial [Gammaproteobacteria bacterium]